MELGGGGGSIEDSCQSIGGRTSQSREKRAKRGKKHALDGGGSSEYSGDFED